MNTSSPSRSLSDATSTSAGRSVVGAPGGLSTAIRRCPSACRCSSAPVTPVRLSNSTSPAASAPASASPIETTASESASSIQNPSEGSIGREDQAVHLLIAQLGREQPLALGIAAGVEDQRVAVMGQQRAPGLGGQPLLPEVLQRRTQDPDHSRSAAGQRAGDRMRLVAEIRGHLAHALLCLLGDLDARAARRRRRRAIAQRRQPPRGSSLAWWAKARVPSLSASARRHPRFLRGGRPEWSRGPTATEDVSPSGP